MIINALRAVAEAVGIMAPAATQVVAIQQTRAWGNTGRRAVEDLTDAGVGFVQQAGNAVERGTNHGMQILDKRSEELTEGILQKIHQLADRSFSTLEYCLVSGFAFGINSYIIGPFREEKCTKDSQGSGCVIATWSSNGILIIATFNLARMLCKCPNFKRKRQDAPLHLPKSDEPTKYRPSLTDETPKSQPSLTVIPAQSYRVIPEEEKQEYARAAELYQSSVRDPHLLFAAVEAQNNGQRDLTLTTAASGGLMCTALFLGPAGAPLFTVGTVGMVYSIWKTAKAMYWK